MPFLHLFIIFKTEEHKKIILLWVTNTLKHLYMEQEEPNIHYSYLLVVRNKSPEVQQTELILLCKNKKLLQLLVKNQIKVLASIYYPFQ